MTRVIQWLAVIGICAVLNELDKLHIPFWVYLVGFFVLFCIGCHLSPSERVIPIHAEELENDIKELIHHD
jgi:hypothetical protein